MKYVSYKQFSVNLSKIWDFTWIDEWFCSRFQLIIVYGIQFSQRSEEIFLGFIANEIEF